VTAHPLVPRAFVDLLTGVPSEGGPDGTTWLRRLPSLLEEVLDAWSLTPCGASMNGWTAIVIPVERDGQRLMCKIGWPHHEASGEHLALRHWAGNGAARLYAADPGRGALLLEALDPARDLSTMWVEEACEVIGGLLARLHVPAPPTIRRLSEVGRAQVEGMGRAGDLLPRRLVTRATGIFNELSGDPSCDATLLHTDLHYENVLAAEREPWLAIDPKPMAGHPGVELVPLLRNRAQEMGSGSSFRWSVRRRVEVTCEAAGIEERVARLWTIFASTVEASWAARDGDRDRTSLHIALAKALED
jgi:streptomycin 6-kinase